MASWASASSHHLPLTDEPKAILATPGCAQWIMGNVNHGCAAAFDDSRMYFRIQDDADAERFRERWL